jgi:DNA gyrase subunit A
MMVSDQGQIIRAPVDDIRIASRNTRGVILFRTSENEHVVSVERLDGAADQGGEGEDDIGDEIVEGPADE